MATPTDDDNADDCISGNYYGYERGGTLAIGTYIGACSVKPPDILLHPAN